MTVELLACPNPWCEADERDGDYSPAVRLHHFGDYRVVCTSCMTEGPLRPTEDEAIAAWNTRSALEGVAGLVDAGEDAQAFLSDIVKAGSLSESWIKQARTTLGHLDAAEKAMRRKP